MILKRWYWAVLHFLKVDLPNALHAWCGTLDGALPAALQARRLSRPLAIKHPPVGRPRVLIAGVYLADRANHIEHLVTEFAASRLCEVEQRWVALNGAAPSPAVAAVTVETVSEREPKFSLVNRVLSRENLDDVDFLIIVDDDIRVQPGFVDAFIGWQQWLGFGLAQPARTWGSFMDYKLAGRSLFSHARQTQFVEIGPLFSMDRTMRALCVPFDEASPMGWGYDFIWPVIAADHGIALGIIDATPVEHSLRPRSDAYSFDAEYARMQAFLKERRHVSRGTAMRILRHIR